MRLAPWQLQKQLKVLQIEVVVQERIQDLYSKLVSSKKVIILKIYNP